MFKLIGTIAGFFVLGLLGAVIGFVIGLFIDRVRRFGVGATNPMTNALRQQVFMETAFLSLGKLAKADGRVSEAEIAHTEAFMQKLGMTAAHKQQAIAWFKQGAAADFDLRASYRNFMAVCGRTHQLRQVLLALLIEAALTDGELHAEEVRVLENAASWLGYDAAQFRQFLEMVRNQAHFAQGPANQAAALDDAYKALGVTRENTDAEIKRAFRKLISQYHPDKLIGQGLPDDMIAVATEKAKEIQVAYDRIVKSRAEPSSS